MDNDKKEDGKRVIDTYIKKPQLVTPELQDELQKRDSETHVKTQNSARFFLFSSFVGVAIAVVFLFVFMGEPLPETPPINEPLLGVTTGDGAVNQSVNMELFFHIVNSSLKAASAISTNDFETLKTVIVANATIDEIKRTVSFPLETPFVVETKYLPPFSLSNLKIVGYDERDGVDPMLIMRIEEHTYEVMFSKDVASSGEYRILSFTGNR